MGVLDIINPWKIQENIDKKKRARHIISVYKDTMRSIGPDIGRCPEESYDAVVADSKEAVSEALMYTVRQEIFVTLDNPVNISMHPDLADDYNAMTADRELAVAALDEAIRSHEAYVDIKKVELKGEFDSITLRIAEMDKTSDCDFRGVIDDIKTFLLKYDGKRCAEGLDLESIKSQMVLLEREHSTILAQKFGEPNEKAIGPISPLGAFQPKIGSDYIEFSTGNLHTQTLVEFVFRSGYKIVVDIDDEASKNAARKYGMVIGKRTISYKNLLPYVVDFSIKFSPRNPEKADDGVVVIYDAEVHGEFPDSGSSDSLGAGFRPDDES